MKIETNERISINLYRFRTRFPLTQLELAKKSGVSRATIMRIESGSHNPGINILDKLADSLNILASDLLL
jgi:transcriptional regulator with XRE-family HTH domain